MEKKKESSTKKQFKKALICDKMLCFPGGWDGKESCLQGQETQVRSLGQEDPLEKEILSPSYICQENPIDRGAWWAAVHGVANKHNWATDTYDQLFYAQLSVKRMPYFCVFIGRGGNRGEGTIFKLKLCKEDWPTNCPPGSKTATKIHCKMTIIQKKMLHF